MKTKDPCHLLENIIRSAIERVRTKGRERHSEENEPFENQPIMEISRRLKGNIAAAPLFQVVKKSYETGRMPCEQAIKEIDDAIIYLGAAKLLYMEEWEKQLNNLVKE